MVGGKVLTLVQAEVVRLNQGLGLVLAGRLKETKIFRDAYTSSTLSEFFFVFVMYLCSLCICIHYYKHGRMVSQLTRY